MKRRHVAITPLLWTVKDCLLQAATQEVTSRAPLVQAVQDAGHSLVRRRQSLAVLVTTLLNENNKSTVIITAAHRSEGDTLHLTTSGSV